jgi:hypothetical protein
MRTSRRFYPVLNCMPTRIAPSSVALVAPPIIATPTNAVAMDSTGDPGTNPSGNGTYPIIFTPPGGSRGGGNC